MIVDLDGGSLRVPECVTIPPITECILLNAKKALTMVSELTWVFYYLTQLNRNIMYIKVHFVYILGFDYASNHTMIILLNFTFDLHVVTGSKY